MPGYKVHLTGGIISFSLVYYFTHTIKSFSPTLILFCAAATFFGSLFPDLDVTSKIQHIFYILMAGFLFCAIIIRHWIFFLGGGIIAITIGLLKHRTLLHHPGFLLILPLASMFLLSLYYPQITNDGLIITLFFIIGALSHIFLDFGISKIFKRH